jgi:hypothetical protein
VSQVRRKRKGVGVEPGGMYCKGEVDNKFLTPRSQTEMTIGPATVRERALHLLKAIFHECLRIDYSTSRELYAEME